MPSIEDIVKEKLTTLTPADSNCKKWQYDIQYLHIVLRQSLLPLLGNKQGKSLDTSVKFQKVFQDDAKVETNPEFAIKEKEQKNELNE